MQAGQGQLEWQKGERQRTLSPGPASGSDSWCISTDLTSVDRADGAKVTTMPGCAAERRSTTHQAAGRHMLPSAKNHAILMKTEVHRSSCSDGRRKARWQEFTGKLGCASSGAPEQTVRFKAHQAWLLHTTQLLTSHTRAPCKEKGPDKGPLGAP